MITFDSFRSNWLTFTTCPKHEVVRLCACGLNSVCFMCGDGSGCSPCNCPRPPRALGLGLGSIQMFEDFDPPLMLVNDPDFS